MKPTIAGVKRLVEGALAEHGEDAKVENIRWLSRGWCKPRCGGGPEFKLARLELVSPDGRRVTKAVTVEADGSWSIR